MRHSMFSFMDGFNGYNQIKVHPYNAEKTAYRTLIRNFHYIVTLFGLNNAGAIYQRAVIAIYYHMLNDCLVFGFRT